MKKLLIIPLLLLSLLSKAQISGFELMPRLGMPSLTYKLWSNGTRHLVLDKDSAALIFAPLSGGGSVSSVFGRTGTVVAATNDYTFAQIGTKPTTIGGYGISDFNSLGDARWVALSGAYVNPSWITSIAWSKITATPTTILGYGITDFNSTGDARYLQLTGGALTGALTSNNSASFSGNITSTGGSLIASGLTSTGTNVGISINNRAFTAAGTAITMAPMAVSNSSGVFVGVNITPTYTQTSTAGATDFKINRTETSIGSGSQLLADLQVASVSKFSVDRLGNINSAGHITFEGVTSTGATGTGQLVFGTSPTLTSPALGTPASGVLTNVTGLPTAGLINNAVTYAKMQAVTTNKLLGSGSGTAVAEITLGTNLSFTGTTLNAAGFTEVMTTLGDVDYYTGSVRSRLAGNTTTTQKFLTSTGNGTISATPAYFDLFGGNNTWGGNNTLNGALNLNGGANFKGGIASAFYNTANTFSINLGVNTVTANRNITLPDASGELLLNTSGSFSATGTTTTTFTVTIGTTQANTTYKVNVTPTSLVAAALFYVNNKTTTTFDVVYVTGLTGAVSFDWSLFK